MGRLKIDSENLLIGGGLVSITVGGFIMLTSHFEEVDTVNQENPEYSRIINNSVEQVLDSSSTNVGGRIVHSADCAIDENGKILGVFSGDERVSGPVNGGSLTMSFSETKLPDAVPDALGHCDVTVKDAGNNVVDTYKVNAYKPAMLQYFPPGIK